MALTFIAGPSGCGKSHYIYSKIIKESLENKDRHFFILVPEQFTMQTQRELVRLHPSHSILNIDVLSFGRLAQRVFDETGFTHEPILEEMGKTLVIQKIIWDNKKDLSVLGKTMQMQGGAAEAKSMISELMQYCVGAEDIEAVSKNESISPLLSKKLDDIGVIYKGMKDYLKGKYLAAEETNEALSFVMRKSEMIKDSVVIFDGFTGFLPMQLAVVSQILMMAKDVYAAVTLGENEKLSRKSSPSSLFHMTHQMVGTLKRLAFDNGIAINETVYINSENGRLSRNAPIDFIEKNIFRYSNKVYEKEPEEVRIFEADSTKEEIAFVSSAISNLVRTKGYKYRDIAVVCADIKSCGRRMKNYFDDCNIPSFLDEKRNVSTNPYVRFIKGITDVIANDFSVDSVFSYLKSGLTDLLEEEIDLLENYILAAGIKGFKKYDSVWARKTKNADTEQLIYLNSLRTRLMDEIRDTVLVFKKRMSTVREKTAALYDLSVKCGVQVKLKKMEETYSLKGERSREREYAQIYKAVCDLFDKMVQILGDEKIGIAAYAKLIEAGFEQMRLGIIPTGPDEVLIGDIERTRVKNIKAVIFMDVNDGLVPKHKEAGGLLSEDDREILEREGILLAPTVRENMYRQRFYLYLTLTLASEHLIITYKKKDDDGSAVMPSYLIGTLRKMFPLMKKETVSDLKCTALETAIGREMTAVKYLQAAVKGENEDSFFQMVVSLKEDKNAAKRLERYIQASKERKRSATIGEKAAEAIYYKKYSVSRLQEFASCAFKHFCKYGLMLKEREKYELAENDMGNIFHAALKNFASLAENEGTSLSDDDGKTAKLMKKAVYDALADERLSSILDGGRNRATLERITRILFQSAKAVVCQSENGEFKIKGLESHYELGDINGTIDRYDTCDIGDVTYVRVIDYKSGKIKLDYTELFHGLQLQLPVYMIAALDKVRSEGKTAQPAGIYYMMLKYPLLDEKSMADEADPDKCMHVTGLMGLSLDDLFVFNAQASNKEEAYKIFSGASLNKDGTFAKNASLFSAENFKILGLYSEKLMEEMKEKIKGGTADINPVATGSFSSCQYCKYSGICGYDETIPGYYIRLLESHGLSDICEAMERRLLGGKEDE